MTLDKPIFLWYINSVIKRKREKMTVQVNKVFNSIDDGINNMLDAAAWDYSDKKLHQHYKGLSAAVVKEAFGWDDNFMLPEPDVYPQASRSASGLVADA